MQKKRKPVIGINSKTGEYIEFISCTEAGKFFKKSSSKISKACLGKIYQAYGYIWKYKNEFNEPYKPKDRSFKKYYNRTAVIKINKETKEETFYSGACELKKEGFDPSSILKVCKGKNKSTKGFIFRLASKEEIRNWELKRNINE